MNQTPYDEIAEWYDVLVESGGFVHDLVLPSVYSLIGDPRGLRICDLACGQGWVSRELAQRGATVIGIDLSRKLLEIARRYQESQPDAAVYLQGDAQMLAFRDAVFDGVVCNMALMDIPDLNAALHSVRRILKPAGWFVFSLTHPCLETIKAQTRWMGDQAVMSYFTEGLWRSDNREGVRGKVGAYHRTLSTYINTLSQTGFVLEYVIEPQAAGDAALRYPSFQDIPVGLVVRCVKR